MNFQIHDVEWTEEKVSRFWDSFNALHLAYFAEQAGKDVIRICKKYINLNDKILDYGSGKGFLIGYLLEDGAKSVAGCDFSGESVDYVNKLFATNSSYKGTTHLTSLPSQLPSASFGSVFFMETIEHLIDKHYEPTLAEISRLVKKGGHLIITTRNEENLDNLKVICPDCGAMFHRVQHVRSFSKQSITETMSRYGFEVVSVAAKDLGRRGIASAVVQAYRALKGQLNRNPNLIYIGRKVS